MRIPSPEEVLGRIKLAGWRYLRSRKPRPSFEPGGYYAVRSGDDRWGIAKVLLQDKWAVHIRVYSDRFVTPPAEIDASALFMHEIDGIRDGKPLGIGHLPLTPENFQEWDPVLVLRGDVAEDELDGYREWKGLRGGIFGEPSS